MAPWNGPNEITVADDPGCRRPRSTARGDAVLPRSYTKTSDQRIFAVKAPLICNGLPTAVHNTHLSLNSFRRELKTFYFFTAYVRNQAHS